MLLLYEPIRTKIKASFPHRHFSCDAQHSAMSSDRRATRTTSSSPRSRSEAKRSAAPCWATAVVTRWRSSPQGLTVPWILGV